MITLSQDGATIKLATESEQDELTPIKEAINRIELNLGLELTDFKINSR